jgi:hypothetical protein
VLCSVRFVHNARRSLSYRVLEVNASAPRTSRAVLQLVAEATQSHQLALGDDAVRDATTIVLFEEIDVRGPDDQGFFAALHTLLCTTKRPLVLTCNGACRSRCERCVL